MKRVELSEAKLEEVIRYRQGGLSWLAIENASGVSRKVARRAYEEWQRARSIRELENVRVGVGQIELEGHIDVVTRFARYLVEHLAVPERPDFTRDAEAHLASLMEMEIVVLKSEVASKASEGRVKARNIRRNRLLLESLKTHTADVLRWDSLNDWMVGWDACYRAYPGVSTKMGEVIGSTFIPYPDVEEWFGFRKGNDRPLDVLGQRIKVALWKGMVAGEVDRAISQIHGEKAEIWDQEYLNIDIGGRSLLQRDNLEMTPSFIDLCYGIIKELWGTGEVSEIVRAVVRMRAVVEEMEAVLEPLVLRPQILHTRCKICPA